MAGIPPYNRSDDPVASASTSPGEALYCPGCGYDLRGNESVTCPECGDDSPFALRYYYNDRQRAIQPIKAFAVLANIVLMVAGVVLAMMAANVVHRMAGTLVFPIALAGCAWYCFHIAQRLLYPARMKAGLPPPGGLMLTALTAGLLLLLPFVFFAGCLAVIAVVVSCSSLAHF